MEIQKSEQNHCCFSKSSFSSFSIIHYCILSYNCSVHRKTHNLSRICSFVTWEICIRNSVLSKCCALDIQNVLVFIIQETFHFLNLSKIVYSSFNQLSYRGDIIFERSKFATSEVAYTPQLSGKEPDPFIETNGNTHNSANGVRSHQAVEMGDEVR